MIALPIFQAVSTPFVWHFPFYNSVNSGDSCLACDSLYSTFFPGNCNPVYLSPSCIWGTDDSVSIAPIEYHILCFSLKQQQQLKKPKKQLITSLTN